MENTAPAQFVTTIPYEAFGALMNTNDGHVINVYRDGTSHTAGGVVSVRESTTTRLASNPNDWDFYTGTRFGSAGSCAYSGCFFADATLDSDNMNGNCDPVACVIFFQVDDGVHCCSSGALMYVSTCTQPCSASGTWSTPTTISGVYTPTNENLVVVPGGAVSSTYPSGALLEVALDGSLQCQMIASTNHGSSWSTVGPVTGCAGTEEIGLAYAGGNQLLGFLRPGQGSLSVAAPMILIWTNNMGTSWSSENTNIDRSPVPCCNSSGVPFTPTTTMFYQMLSPWIVNQGLSSGQWTVLLGERQAWNGSVATTFGWIRAITFDPTKVIANPTSLSYGQVLDFRNIDSFVSEGYPSAAQTTDSTHLLVQFNAEKTFAGAVQLFTFKAQYVNNGTVQSSGTTQSSGFVQAQ